MAVARIDPFAKFNFTVEIPTIARANFSEVCGLGLEVGVIEYRDGNDPVLNVRKLPGLVKYNNIILKRGFTQDHSLWDWARQSVQGNIQRVDVVITMLNNQRQPVGRWVAHNAWVSKYEGPALNAKSNDVAMESVEIAHEGIDFVAP